MLGFGERTYYWSEEQAWRQPIRIGVPVLRRCVALPQFANSTQRCLFVSFRKTASGKFAYIDQAWGTIRSFDGQGLYIADRQFEFDRFIEAFENALDYDDDRAVVKLEPRLRRRRLKEKYEEHYWKPTTKDLDRVVADLQGAARAIGVRAIPILKKMVWVDDDTM